LGLGNFLKNEHRRNCFLFSKRITLHKKKKKKIMVFMQARHLVAELKPPGLQNEQACSGCKDLFYYAIYEIYCEIYEGFYQVVPNFIWVVYLVERPGYLVAFFFQKPERQIILSTAIHV
jgi:hypothetical protein